MSKFGMADFLRMAIYDVTGRLNRLLNSTIIRRDADVAALKKFEAEYKPNPVAESHGYDPIGDEAMMVEQIERLMFAIVAVAINSEKESFVIRVCRELELSYKDEN